MLDSAASLFYREGIRATGVDRIVARAGVTKPTLYAHFASKSALTAAVLERRHQDRRTSFEEHLQARSESPAEERLLSVFDWVAGQQHGDGRRGCPFVNASVELVRPGDAPARAVVKRHKAWFRAQLSELAAQAGAADPVSVASQLHVLIEGANARMLAEGDVRAIEAARRVAALVLAEECGGGGRPRRAGGGTPQWEPVRKRPRRAGA